MSLSFLIPIRFVSFHFVFILYGFIQNDWGGVGREFWYDAARENTYGWNIDPESIEMMDDTIHKSRYHVFMLKNK